MYSRLTEHPRGCEGSISFSLLHQGNLNNDVFSKRNRIGCAGPAERRAGRPAQPRGLAGAAAGKFSSTPWAATDASPRTGYRVRPTFADFHLSKLTGLPAAAGARRKFAAATAHPRRVFPVHGTKVRPSCGGRGTWRESARRHCVCKGAVRSSKLLNPAQSPPFGEHDHETHSLQLSFLSQPDSRIGPLFTFAVVRS